MKTKKTVIAVECDRCKSTEDTNESAGRNEFGETNLTYTGHTGGRTYAGDIGGSSHKGAAWLCLSCTRAFFDFMANKPVHPASAKSKEGLDA